MGDPLADNAYGIDVSHWQQTTPSLAGLDFLFARATIGTVTDEMYGHHIAKAKAAGLVTGAYHFGDNGTTADAQARAFLAAAGDVDFYALDHEAARRMTAAQAKRFIALVEAATGRGVLYASLSGFPDFGQDLNWIALWASTPPASIRWTFWQFGGSPLDHDVFNGTPAELRAFAGRKEIPVSYELKFERWKRNSDGVLVTTVGAPKRSDGTVDYSSRLVILGSGAARRLDPIDRAALTPVSGSLNDAFFDALVHYSEPLDQADVDLAVAAALAAIVPKLDVTPFDQADIDAAIAAAAAAQAIAVSAALAEGATSEHERLALAEADRIREL